MQYTQIYINKYFQNLLLHRYTLKQLTTKIKNDFNLQEFSIFDNDCEVLQENDDSFIFTIEVDNLIVDVTLYYIFTNQKDIFLVTEIICEFYEN